MKNNQKIKDINQKIEKKNDENINNNENKEEIK